MKVAKQRSRDLARLAALVRQMVGMLTTIEADGSLRSRPLETEVDSVGRLWFFTEAGSPKAARAEAAGHQVSELRRPARRGFRFDFRHRARGARSGADARAGPRMKRCFPQAWTPDLALLEVRIDKAEYWDEPLRENVKIGTLAPQHQA